MRAAHGEAQRGELRRRPLQRPGALLGGDAERLVSDAQPSGLGLVGVVKTEQLDGRAAQGTGQLGGGPQVGLVVVDARHHAHAQPDAGAGVDQGAQVREHGLEAAAGGALVPLLALDQLEVIEEEIHVGQGRLIRAPGRVARGFHGDRQTPLTERGQQAHQAGPRLEQRLAAAQGHPAVGLRVVGSVLFDDSEDVGEAGGPGRLLEGLGLRVLAPAAPHVAAAEENGRADAGAVVDAGPLDLEHGKLILGGKGSAGRVDHIHIFAQFAKLRKVGPIKGDRSTFGSGERPPASWRRKTTAILTGRKATLVIE